MKRRQALISTAAAALTLAAGPAFPYECWHRQLMQALRYEFWTPGPEWVCTRQKESASAM